jgi:hypothetical protein
MHRGNQFHEIAFVKPGTMVLSKNDVALNIRLHTESHETLFAQRLHHVIVCMTNLKQRLFYETS